MEQTESLIITGIQPTNKITLGNFFGAIDPLIDLQKTYKIYAFVANLHSITVNFDSNNLANNIKNVVLSYLAAGVDPRKVKIFIQSDVHAHCELSHVLMCHTTIGELKRMTQFKDKSQKLTASNGTDYIPTGLLLYPVLMAADILLYDANFVTTGADQKQHIELTRNIAQRFNNKYGKTFVMPEPLIPPHGSRIMDLLNPSIKMSKSNSNEKGTIFLSDKPKEAASKIMGAKTDSLNQVKFAPTEQPGVSNLLTIYSCLTGIQIETIVSKYVNKSYKDFKKDLASIVQAFLEDFQKKYAMLEKKYPSIRTKLETNAKFFNKISEKKLATVYKKIGFK